VIFLMNLFVLLFLLPRTLLVALARRDDIIFINLVKGFAKVLPNNCGPSI
jgi:hypothetical protein